VAITLVGVKPALVEPSSFVLENPRRLVLDLPGLSLAPAEADRFPVGVGALRQVRAGQFELDPPVVRLVLDLAEEGELPPWRVEPGKTSADALIVVDTAGETVLRPPSVDTVGDTVFVRVAGVGLLTRRVGVLSDPPRVFVDVFDAEVEASYTQELGDGLIRQIRMAQQPAVGEHSVARLVLEFARETPHSVFTDGCDLVVAAGQHVYALPVPKYQGSGLLEGKRFVVDPGHGGKDTGALFVSAQQKYPVLEKRLTLDIGRRLADLLTAEGAEVTLTRDGDSYIALAERAAIANRIPADAFVSVHCNSCVRPNTLNGTSVYYDHQHSLRLAELVQGEMVAALSTADKGVRNANFAVIRRTTMPGVLVETAFINHDDDRARLLTPQFRERAARAILRGLIAFFREDAEAGRAVR
jgi:N-acetylmuramoyl-L-alanine amidase